MAQSVYSRMFGKCIHYTHSQRFKHSTLNTFLQDFFDKRFRLCKYGIPALNMLFCTLQVEMMFWLLSMLASRDREEMSRVLLAMSSSQESCIAMRKSGCVPLLVQILHDVSSGKTAETTGCSREARSRASAALHNIVYSQPDEGQARREMRVLHVLEQIRSHCENGWDWIENHLGTPSPSGTKTIGEYR